MHCPDIGDLPPPPAGKTGWPWTEGATRTAGRAPDGRPWPRVTLVTPSFNQGAFIEETIRSVLLQGYPDLEYVIMDGGSTDGTVEVIRKYERWLARWVSQKDAGQSAAINAGFENTTGHVMAYLNSDDYYLPGALAAAAEALNRPDAAWCAGDATILDEKSRRFEPSLVVMPRDWIDQITRRARIPQPATFWTRPLWHACGAFDSTMFFSFDWDLYCRFLLKGCRPTRIPRALAVLRYHEDTKTSRASDRMKADDAVIRRRCLAACPWPRRTYARLALWWNDSPRVRFWSDPLNWAAVTRRKLARLRGAGGKPC